MSVLLMKSILVVGGTFRYKEYHSTEYGFFGGCDVEKYVNLCYKYKVNKWTKVAELQKEWCSSACTVFEGKIVATGGSNYNGSLRSVEAYDHHENKWTNLTDMLRERSNHSVGCFGNKMYVMGSVYSSRYRISSTLWGLWQHH